MDKLKSVSASDFKYIYVILGAFFAELSLILLVTYFPSYAIAQGASESTSLLLLTVWNATGILGRWIPGFVSDIYGRYNVYVFMLILYCLCIFVLLYPFGSSEKSCMHLLVSVVIVLVLYLVYYQHAYPKLLQLMKSVPNMGFSMQYYP